MSIRGLYRLLISPRRSARSRGFGIHSPFAFRFVGEVLRQPCGYYAYHTLDALARKEGLDRSIVRTLYRIALAMRPGRVELRGVESYALSTALQLGGRAKADSPVKAIVGLSDAAGEVAGEWNRSERGMLFSAPEMAVFVISDNLPKQRFDIFIK